MSDAAIATLASAAITIVTMLTGFFTLWIKLKYNVKEAAKEVGSKVDDVNTKVDHNTEITKQGAKEAVNNAKEAAGVAKEAKEAAKEMSKKLNGGIDTAIEAAIKPIRDALTDIAVKFDEHVAADNRNLEWVRKSLDDLHRKIK